MSKPSSLVPAFFALLTVSATLIAGCGREGAAPDEAEIAAGRETVEGMSREHSDDSAEPSPAAKIAPAQAVISDPRMPYSEAR